MDINHSAEAHSNEERQAIAARISVGGERIIIEHEVSVQSAFSVRVMYERICELSQHWPRFSMLVDLTQAQRPSAPVRAELKKYMSALSPRLIHVAFSVGDNIIMRAMVRVVALGFGYRSISVHRTFEQALEELRHVTALQA